MFEWQKLTINAFMNIGVALIVGGILRLMLDFTSIVSCIVVFFMGSYILFACIVFAKNIEIKDT